MRGVTGSEAGVVLAAMLVSGDWLACRPAKGGGVGVSVPGLWTWKAKSDAGPWGASCGEGLALRRGGVRPGWPEALWKLSG